MKDSPNLKPSKKNVISLTEKRFSKAWWVKIALRALVVIVVGLVITAIFFWVDRTHKNDAPPTTETAQISVTNTLASRTLTATEQPPPSPTHTVTATTPPTMDSPPTQPPSPTPNPILPVETCYPYTSWVDISVWLTSDRTEFRARSNSEYLLVRYFDDFGEHRGCVKGEKIEGQTVLNSNTYQVTYGYKFAISKDGIVMDVQLWNTVTVDIWLKTYLQFPQGGVSEDNNNPGKAVKAEWDMVYQSIMITGKGRLPTATPTTTATPTLAPLE